MISKEDPSSKLPDSTYIIGEIMLQIQLSREEELDKAISRFKKLIAKEGIITEVKRREYFIKPSLLKHEKNKSIQRKRTLKSKKQVHTKES